MTPRSSRDSRLWAGMLALLWVVTASTVAVTMFAAEGISRFVNRHPTIKVLALSFLLLIGLALVGDGVGMHIPKGYVYFAMGFSLFVEMINLRVRAASNPVTLHQRYEREQVK